VISQDLLEILACPACESRPKVALEGQDKLVCTACGRRYPIRDDIPVMLVEEAELPAGGSPAAGKVGEPAPPRPN
jgi:uncharacterized protein YbaR (Trm112 family)